MAARRNKKEVQREQTSQSIIEAAESLFAEQGIAAVSLRQIAEHAGSLNTSVVGYYFGSKEALVEAIWRHRLAGIEQWRTRFLAEIDSQGRGMVLDELLKAVLVPWYEQRDKEGRHSYGRFLLSMDRAGLIWIRFALDPEYPASFEAHNRLKRYFELHQIPHAQFRFAMQINMMLDTLQFIDRSSLSEEDAKVMFFDAIAMASAALTTGAQTTR